MRALAPLFATAILTSFAPDARAEDPALLGLFEGHNVARPRGASAARAAERAVNRVRDLCYSSSGMGFEINGTDARACAAAGAELMKKSADAAPFILDTIEFGESDDAWRSRLLDALAHSGREDVVPPLVRAVERYVIRPEARIGEEGRAISLGELTLALEKITHAAPANVAPWLPSREPAEIARAWRDWLDKNAGKKRAEWMRQAHADFEQRAGSAEEDEAFLGVQSLCLRRETRAVGKKKLAAFLARAGLSADARSAGEELARSVAEAEKKR